MSASGRPWRPWIPRPIAFSTSLHHHHHPANIAEPRTMMSTSSDIQLRSRAPVMSMSSNECQDGFGFSSAEHSLACPPGYNINADVDMASPVYTLTEATANPPRNSTIVITGGASGIGLATGLYLHKPEYKNNVVALDISPNAPNLPELKNSSRFLYCQCDVLSWTSQRDAFAKAASKFGGIDCVFVNAGLAEIGEQIWTDVFDDQGQLQEPNRATIDVDIRAVGDTLKLAMYHLRNDGKGSGKGKGGSIVMTASLAGYLASAGAPLYSAAKHGVVGYLRALKGDCAKTGIAISVIAPGITLTPIILGRREGQSLEDWGKDMSDRGVPINNAETIALTVANLFGQGMKANGSGVLIQANRMQELEAGIAKSRQQWMGKEMLDLFRGGRNAPLFPNKL